MVNQTLNTILNFIGNFAENNPFIRQFKSGDMNYYDTEDMSFPSMWVAPTNSSINQINRGVISNSMSFQVMILDRANQTDDGDNELEIISDSIQVLEDLVFELSRDSKEFSLETSISYQPVQQGAESTNSREVGIVATLTIKKPFVRCSTPKTN